MGRLFVDVFELKSGEDALVHGIELPLQKDFLLLFDLIMCEAQLLR